MDNKNNGSLVPLLIAYCRKEQLPELDTLLKGVSVGQMLVCAIITKAEEGVLTEEQSNYVEAKLGMLLDRSKSYYIPLSSKLTINCGSFVSYEGPQICDFQIFFHNNVGISILMDDTIDKEVVADNIMNNDTLFVTRSVDAKGSVFYTTNVTYEHLRQPSMVADLMRDFWDVKQSSIMGRPNDNQEEVALLSLFAAIKDNIGHDFLLYKRNSIRRHIEKRMLMVKVKTISEYLKFIEGNNGEIDLLAKEFMVNVTSFFRDADAFEKLNQTVVSKLVTPDRIEDIRVWVAACSSGEEAYSVAMMLREMAKTTKCMANITVFASDIDKTILVRAREGVFTQKEVSDVPEDLLSKYFTENKERYTINKEIRDMVIFAEHNVLQSPPFSNLDLVSCRNMMIYLEVEAQQSALKIFHYSLKPNAYLFLGSSETLGDIEQSFKVIDRQWRIYQKTDGQNLGNRKWSIPDFSSYRKDLKNRSTNLLRDLCTGMIVEKFAPPCVVVNSAGNILYSQGQISQFLEFPQGEPSTNIVKASRQGLAIPLANALRKAKFENQEVRIDDVDVILDSGTISCDLVVTSVDGRGLQPGLQIVTFITKPEVGRGVNVENDFAGSRKIAELEKELGETQDYLQNVISDFETTNEELRSVEEESQSISKELRLATQELDDLKVKLQHANDEIDSISMELLDKIDEVARLSDDESNLLACYPVAAVFVDEHMVVTKFTPTMKKNVGTSDFKVGVCIDILNSKLDCGLSFDSLATKVLEQNLPEEREISIANGKICRVTVRPYNTHRGNTKGVIMTFDDITEKRKNELRLNESKNKFDELLESLSVGWQNRQHNLPVLDRSMDILFLLNPDLICITDLDGCFKKINPAWTSTLGYMPQELIDHSSFEFVHPDDEKRTREYVLSRGVTNPDKFFGNRYRDKRGQYHMLEWNILVDSDNALLYGVARDVSERVEIETKTAEIQSQMKLMISNIPNGMFSLLDIKGNFVCTGGSEYYCRGIEPEELIGRPFLTIVSPSSIERVLSYFEKAKGGESVEFEDENDGNSYVITMRPVIENGDIVYIIHTSRNVTHQVKTRHALEAANERILSIFNTAASLIITISPDQSIVECNRRIYGLLGYKKNEVTGKDISMLLCPESLDSMQEIVDDVLNDRKVYDQDLQLLKKNGDIVYVSVNASKVERNSDGNYSIICVFSDVSKLRKMHQELDRKNAELNRNIEEIEDINYMLEKAKIKAEEGDRLKSAFLANMSHEIRTPMNSILGFSELVVSDDDMNKDKHELYCSLIRSSGEQLLRIINDIIDISKIESNQLKTEKVQVKVLDLINETIEQQKQSKYFIEKKDVEIRTKNTSTLSELAIYTDPVRLRQIFTNLINNAIKNTEHGYVELGFERVDDNVMFYVKDTGCGIAKSEQKRIFDRFIQGYGRINQGTGLGLSIVKGLVSLLGGKIWLESELGVGSIFYFTLPLDPSVWDGSAVTLRSMIKRDFNFFGKTLYVAEDDDSSYIFVKEVLGSTKINIEQAINGRELLILMDNTLPDVVLIDTNMPVMDGFETMKQVRAKYPHIPIIAQTVYQTAEEREKCLSLGCSDYISKPINKGELLVALNKCLYGE